MVKLGLMPPYMAEDIEKAYLAKIKDIRPDLGGDPQAFYDVQTAYMQAKEYLKFRGDRRGWIAKRMDEYLATQEVTEQLKSLRRRDRNELRRLAAKVFRRIRRANGKRSRNSAATMRRTAMSSSTSWSNTVDQLLWLERLDLTGCKVTDSAVRQLSVFRRLQELDLSRTPITWQALHIVHWLPELHDVRVEGTQINWFSRRKLASQLREKRKTAKSLRAIHPTTMR